MPLEDEIEVEIRFILSYNSIAFVMKRLTSPRLRSDYDLQLEDKYLHHRSGRKGILLDAV